MLTKWHENREKPVSTYFIAMVMRADIKVEKQHGSHAKYAAEQIDGVEGILLCDVTTRGDAQTDAYVP